MKAFVIERYSKQEPVRLVDVPEPTLGEQDVLVQIHAASINPLDLKIRSGALKRVLPLRLPLVLGNDLAGVVTRVGAKVQGFKPGDEVYARTDTRRIGTFAEFIAVAESNLALKPASLSMEEAASIPLVGLTAWQALVEKGQLSDPAGQASGRVCRDYHQQRQCRAGEKPRCGSRSRLQEGRFRQDAA